MRNPYPFRKEVRAANPAHFDTAIGLCVQCRFSGVWLFYLEWDVSMWAFYCDDGFGNLVPCKPVDAVLAD